jgi:C4-dicarboxylate-specific signal transduction histidine kinase
VYDKLKNIKDSAESAAQLTAQLLAFSRRQILKQEVINLNDVIKKME